MMSGSRIYDRLRSRFQRDSATYLFRRQLQMRNEEPLITFTFDDFPRSALLCGGTILNEAGFGGTYYASLGLMGKEAPTGSIFLPQDLELFKNGLHDLGCHTYSHCDSWESPPGAFEQDVIENARALGRFLPGARFETFSYPLSCPRPSTKRRMQNYFATCRGGGQKYNAGVVDLNRVNAFFIEKSRNDLPRIKCLIQEAVAHNGWLVFATHDVNEQPTPFGCTPSLFEEIVSFAADSGARVLTMNAAFRAVCGKVPKLKTTNALRNWSVS